MFKKKSVKNVDINWDDVKEIKKSLKKLKSYKKRKVEITGSLAKSKLAWKVASLQQSYIYRVCELADACVINWNNGHYIASLMVARGIIETGVMFCAFDDNVQKGLDNKDLSFLDKDVMKKMFSTRIEELLDEEREYLATNIMTFIEKKDKEIEGLKFIYDNLSECAHPNQFGHFQHYGSLDRSNGTVTFSNGKHLKAKFHSIFCAFSFVDLSVLAASRLEENIEKVAELQHEVNPVST